MEPAAVLVPKPPLKQRLSALFAEYGAVAIYVYLVMSLLTIAGFSIAIWLGLGVEPTSATGVLGVIGAGWLMAKATMPIRIPIAIALTPWIARIVKRRRAARGEDPPTLIADDDDDDDDDDDE